MISDTTIRKLVDFILLNACSVNSSGLYNGKAGISLVLFETARYLQDEYIEKQAFDLLQESLLSKNEDISFENGLSGIGYVLLYLIKNNFIDAGFEELFAENHTKIENELRVFKKKQRKDEMFLFLTVVYYLCFLSEVDIKNETKWYIDYASQETSKLLIDRFSSVKENQNRYSKMDILNIYQLYLKVGYYCSFFNPTTEVLKNYTELYNRNKLASNFFIGFYLNSLANKLKHKEIEIVSIKNKKTAICGICSEILTLSERLDMLHLLYKDKNLYSNMIKQIENNFLEVGNDEQFEKELIQSIHPTDSIVGYQSGVTRFLLYYVYQNTNRDNQFQFL